MAGRLGGVSVGIQFQADVALVFQLYHGLEDVEKPNHAVPGNEMIVNPGRSNVLYMHMAHVFEKRLKGHRRILAGTKKMADIKIQPYHL